MPDREDTYPEPFACEVGYQVPFLVAFIPCVTIRYLFAAG